MTPASELKRGHRIQVDGEAFAVIDVAQQTATARGGGTLVRLKLRNLRTGQLLDRAFKGTERLPQPDFERRQVQFLYQEGDQVFHFMDTSSYEQFSMERDRIADEVGYLKPEDEVRGNFLDGVCIGFELPTSVELKVVETEPGSQGDTVSKVMKPATLETGIIVPVPLFVNEGDVIVVDTREARYVKRA
ncbi:MAG: elongation factor P [Deltaproteobacteria bacterium]|nr:elongation factor P [Deltaproteobacteria bacterium]